MADINTVSLALCNVRRCETSISSLEGYLAVNSQGACIMNIRLGSDSPEWGAIKAIIQAKVTQELEAAKKAFQEACHGSQVTDNQTSRTVPSL